ncbi:DNA polymerase III subunit delta [soil metagenome]
MSSESPVRIVLGEEELLRSRAVDAIVAAARQGDPDCDVQEVAAGQLDRAGLYDLLSPSLFAVRRVIVLADAHEAGKDITGAIGAYAADPVPEITVVLVHPGSARNKAFVDGLRRDGVPVIECPRMTRAEERAAFVRAEVAGHDGSIEPGAAAALLDAVGTDLRELAAACSQLVADTGGRIDAAAVNRYHRGRAEVNGFTVADRAVVGDGPGAIEALRWALSVGVAHVLVADALADGVRSVARVSSAGRADPYQLSRALGMPPWKVKRAQSQSRGWSERGLHRAMQVVADVNAEVKGTAADPGYALERAVRLVVAARVAR